MPYKLYIHPKTYLPKTIWTSYKPITMFHQTSTKFHFLLMKNCSNGNNLRVLFLWYSYNIIEISFCLLCKLNQLVFVEYYYTCVRLRCHSFEDKEISYKYRRTDTSLETCIIAVYRACYNLVDVLIVNDIIQKPRDQWYIIWRILRCIFKMIYLQLFNICI